MIEVATHAHVAERAHHAISVASLGDPALVDILEARPPPGRISIIIHNMHHKAAVPHEDAVFAISRSPRFFAHLGALAPGEGTSQADIAAVDDWCGEIYTAMVKAGLKLDAGHWAFTPAADCELGNFFGNEATQRLRVVKKRYDSGNTFGRMYPSMALMSEK
jgi:hypothetical protein